MTQSNKAVFYDLLNIVRKRIVILIIIPVLSIITCGIYNYYYLPNIYQASTTLMVVKTQTVQNPVEYSLLLANRQLVPTYSELAKSRSVAMKVLEVTKVDLSYGQYCSMVDVQMVRDTELIQINIADTLPGRAKMLANATAKAFIEKIEDIMEVNNIKIVDEAIEPLSPIKPQRLLNVIISSILSTLFAIFIIFLMEYFDNTLKTKEDVERYLSLPVIGSIQKIKSI